MSKKFFITSGLFILVLGALIFYYFDRQDGTTVVNVAAILPFTGDYAEYGQYEKEGIELALEETGAQKQLVMIYEDSHSNARDGLTAFTRVISLHDIPVCISLASSIVKAIAPAATEKKIITIATVSAAKDLFVTPEWGFRWYPTSDIVSKTMIAFAVKRLGAKRVALLYENVDYGLSAYNLDKELLNKEGLEIVFADNFPSGATDFRTLLLKTNQAKPEVVLLHTTGGSSLANLISQFKELRISANIITDDSISFPEVVQKVGAALDGVHYAITSFDPKQPANNLAEKFVQSYEVKYGKAPTDIAAFAYDITKILNRFAANGAKTSIQFRDSLASISNFESVFGRVAVDSHHNLQVPYVVKKFLYKADSLHVETTGFITEP